MSYKEILRVRSLFIKFAITIVSLILLIVLLSGHAHVSVGPSVTEHTHIASAAAGDTTNIYGPGIQVTGVNHGAPYEVLFGIAGFVSAIFALILGAFLATENSGHLEIAWTRPASRVGYALRGIAVDCIGILAAFLFTLVIIAAFVTLEGWWPYLHADKALAVTAVRYVMYPFAWYGLILAVTASLRGGYGIVIGLTWVVASVLAALVTLHLPPAIHATVTFINYVNPMEYGSWSDSTSAQAVMHLLGQRYALIGIAGLVGIAVVGTGASLWQWRGLEA
jgi:hypothetical protein